MEWNYDINKCPTDTLVWLLSADDCFILPQTEYLGTVVKKKNGELTRGICLYGDSEYFYRSKIIAWKHVDGLLLRVFSEWCDKQCINYEYIDESPLEIVEEFLNQRQGDY